MDTSSIAIPTDGDVVNMTTAGAPTKTSRGLLDLPDEVLARIFTLLDRATLSGCYRICKHLNTLLSEDSTIALYHTLMCNNLVLNPHAIRGSSDSAQYIPPSSAQLLSTLRERLTRFRNFTPKHETQFYLSEPEGRLYEYLEGQFLRSVGGGSAYSGRISFYDLNKLDDWEDVEEAEASENGVVQYTQDDHASEAITDQLDSSSSLGSSDSSMNDDQEPTRQVVEDVQDIEDKDLGESIRRYKNFGFNVKEFAIDPGQDLLVLVEMRPVGASGRPGQWAMHFHLLSLSTFEPHPRARNSTLAWPFYFQNSSVTLAFQICDDGLFVLSMNQRHEQSAQLTGWQWTTGWRAITLASTLTMEFESFILLTPTSFAIPTSVTHLDLASPALGDLHNPADISFTYHLRIYAFPPFSEASLPAIASETLPPPWTPTHVTTIDLPEFHYDLIGGIAPPHLDIRTDPPPRATFPALHDGHVQPFVPEPSTGLIIINVYCPRQGVHGGDPVHFVMCLLKETLIKYLPQPTSPLLRLAFTRPVTVVPWNSISKHVRMFGPDIERPNWVCNVYHNRYVQIYTSASNRKFMRLFDLDPLRVLKEIRKRGIEYPWRKEDSPSKPNPARILPGSMPGSYTDQSSNSSTTDDFWDADAPQRSTMEEDGITLQLLDTLLPDDTPGLGQGIVCGVGLPYMYVDKPLRGDTVLLDGERMVTMATVTRGSGREKTLCTSLEY